MTDSQPPEDHQVNNDRTLQQLAWAIASSVGQFKLILARCNYASLRDRLIARLPEISQVEIRVLRLQQSGRTLYTAIREELGEELPACLMVLGWESVDNLAQMLTAANQVREEFRKHFPFPLVLWIDDEVYKQLMQLAPDLESWAITRNFTITQQELIDFIIETANQWFSNNLNLSFDRYLKLETELAAAQQDLIGDQLEYNPEIHANLQSLLGYITRRGTALPRPSSTSSTSQYNIAPHLKSNRDDQQNNHQPNPAVEHYQAAFIIWQRLNNVERTGKILIEIAFCYYRQACNHQDANHVDWQATRHYVQEYINFLSENHHPDLIANSIDQLGEILTSLQQWEHLKSFAQTALGIHQANNQPRELARDYGYLAEVALAQENWIEANQFANQALAAFDTIPSLESVNGSELLSDLPEKILNSGDLSLYRFILGRSQYHLCQIPEAIHSLEAAKEIGNPQGNVRFYLDILSFLQQLYFQQREYLKAYEIKQQRRSVEQQFGLRAFIGAGRLEARKQTLNVETRNFAFLNVETRNFASLQQDNIATEIAASGRQLDVERLIQRLGEPSYKLIVICGQSGVGKSSLVNGGIIPALKKKAIGIQDNLPIVMRVYSNWEEELGRLLGVGEGDEEVGRLVLSGLVLSEVEVAEVWGDEGELEGNALLLEAEDLASEHEVSPSEHEASTPEHEVSPSEHKASTLEQESSPSEHESSPSEQESSPSGHESSPSEHEASTSEQEFSPSEHEASSPEQESSPSPHHPIPPSPHRSLSLVEVPTLLLAQLRENEQRNLRTVLIFDQFEEFFFVYTEPAQRKRFFEFLGECLHVLSVKVILSLRVDYLHYLLECNRLPTMQIIGKDILSNNVLYELGNFSAADAKLIIQRLTENTSFRLEPTLVDQLVEDLAAELGEVRPIELQVVGAQLQTDNITTLAEYQQRGTKEQLVKRYLAEVVQDCGDENQQLAELVLYLLTDEKGTRPLKTRAELERDSEILSPPPHRSQSLVEVGSLSLVEVPTTPPHLDLVLTIFVQSGLVVLLPDNPADRYQLVHDYLAAFIRQQQQPKLKQVMAELEKERKQRQQTEEELKQSQEAKAILVKANRTATQRLRISSGVLFASFVAAGIAAVFANHAYRLNKEAQTGTRLERQGITAYQNFQVQEIEPLLSAMQAGQELQGLVKDNRPLEQYPAASPQLALQTILDNIHEQTRLKGHTSFVYSASFSPDGQRIVTTSEDNTARVWDISGKEIAQLKGHTSRVYSASFSPDGQRIVTTSDDKTARVWDISGKEVAQLRHTSSVNRASFSPDGQRIVTASDDKTARVWDISGKEVAQLKGHTSRVYSASFSPDGQRIVTTSEDNTARVWDISGKEVAQLRHTSRVYSASFSPDGQRIVTTSDDKTARVWDISGKEVAQLKGHTSRVYRASFSPDGQRIVTTSEDNTARVWDISGKEIAQLKGHTSSVYSASFSPDGQRIVTTSDDNTARVWDISGKEVAQLRHTSRVYSASFSPDGQRIVTASEDNTARVWDISGKEVAQLRHTSRVYSASFSPDGQRIVTTSDDKTARVWDISGKEVAQLRHTSPVNRASFSPDGQRIVTTSDDNTARVWDISGKEVAQLKGHTSSVYSASFSPDGQRIVTTSDDNTARVWDISGKEVAQLKGHTSSVHSASFSPDGQRIVTASEDNTARVWDISGKEVAQLRHTSPVNRASFSPDGQRIVTTSEDNTARVWDISGKEVAQLRHTSSVYSASFSPDGQRIVTTSSDNTARVWDISGKEVAQLKGHTSSVYSASFSPDGQRIVTASSDNTARVWDISGKEVAQLKGHTSRVNSASFSPDGQRIVTASSDNTARVWRADNLNQLLSRGCQWLNNYLVTNPKDLETLKVCQNKSNLLAAAPFLVKLGEEEAKAGNIDNAIATFDTAFQWNPSLKFDPQAKAQEFAKKGKAERLISEGERIVREGKVKEAVAAYKEAQRLDPKIEISANSWNTLCWNGSLRGSAKDVLFACEQAVKLAPNTGDVRDSRGLARALTGDTKGAIADFEAYIAQARDQEIKSTRQRWVKELRAGNNPFTDAEIQKLK